MTFVKPVHTGPLGEKRGAGGRLGECYRDAGLKAMDEPERWILVHGRYENPNGFILRHAWCVSKDGNTVWDGERERLAVLFYRQVVAVVAEWPGEKVAECALRDKTWREWPYHLSETEPRPAWLPDPAYAFEPWNRDERVRQFMEEYNRRNREVVARPGSEGTGQTPS